MKGKIIAALVIIAAIVSIAVYIAGNRLNQDVSAGGGNKEPTGSIDHDDERNPDVAEQSPDIAADDKISKQANDELINEMLDSLSDLEETVNSLDDVSDEDLRIPE